MSTPSDDNASMDREEYLNQFLPEILNLASSEITCLDVICESLQVMIDITQSYQADSLMQYKY